MFNRSSLLDTVAAVLDGLNVGCCVFDEADCVLLWNQSMLAFFPEHAGHLYVGEHYRFNLRRFYELRLKPSELHHIDDYIEAGIQRHRTQQQPFIFQHRGQWLRVASLSLEGIGRIRIWTRLPDSEAYEQSGSIEFLSDVSRPTSESQQGLAYVADGLSVVDEQAKIISINDQFMQLYGFRSRNRVLGLRLQEVFELVWRGYEPAEPQAYRLGAQAFQEDLNFAGAPFEVPLPHGRWVRVLEKRVSNGPSYFSHVDITAIKKRQLASEEATRSKSRFLATASHDLRQPVHSLGLLVEMLDQNEPPAQFDARLEAIKNCTTTLNEMLNGILDLSKIDLGAYKVVHETLTMSSLLRDVEETFAPEARRRNLVLSTVGGPHMVLSDRHLLRRIVFNLVSNALKYSRRGTITVACVPAGEKLKLSIKDEGLGIPASRLSTIFDDKLRLAPVREADEGLGVGLTVVKAAADMLGHPIEVYSVEGEGTTFVVTLPLIKPSSEASRAAVSMPQALAAGKNVAGGEAIVFIENDSYTLQSMTELMQAWGYQVHAWANATEACAALRSMAFSPDLIVSDMHLNDEMNGLTAIEALRQTNTGRAIPALLLTGDLDAALYAKARAADVPVIYKPVRPSAFREQLQVMLIPSDIRTAAPLS